MVVSRPKTPLLAAGTPSWGTLAWPKICTLSGTVDKERQKRVARKLLDQYGQTYAEQTGIQLKNTPSPLFQLLVASTLFSARITADKAVQGAKALFDRGLRTPEKMCESSWEQRVEILNKNGYARYDERTARMLGQSAYHLENKYNGDLRELREEADENVKQELELLQEFKGIGEAGAKIFLREVQVVWPEAYPFADEKASEAAEALGLPKTAKSLSSLVGGPQETARLIAALVRVDLEGEERAEELLKSA